MGKGRLPAPCGCLQGDSKEGPGGSGCAWVRSRHAIAGGERPGAAYWKLAPDARRAGEQASMRAASRRQAGLRTLCWPTQAGGPVCGKGSRGASVAVETRSGTIFRPTRRTAGAGWSFEAGQQPYRGLGAQAFRALPNAGQALQERARRRGRALAGTPGRGGRAGRAGQAARVLLA